MKRLVTNLGWRYRVVVVAPMALLGIFDSLVTLVTIGFIQPGTALSWGFRASLRESRRTRPAPTDPKGTTR